VQLRTEFPLSDLAATADYLADLGVSDVYTSPLLQAAPGSTHGYDVVDHRQVSRELGGEPGRRALADRLRGLGLGLVVDLVPNHMSVAVAELNRWWWDVLTHGPASPYAGHFDIDWSRGRLLLPVLGDGPAEVQQLQLVDGELRYHERRFPVAPGTGDGPAAAVHDRQHYELVSWRRGNAELNYRRFFDITELAGLRVEDARVFDDTHDEPLRWVAAGDVTGLRIDHPDGLADPGGYLRRLAARAPDTWVVVEKILQPDERLPEGWACAGTTGYDALRQVGGLFIDPAGEVPLTATYAELTGEPTSAAELARGLKLATARTNLRAEFARLARLAADRPDAEDALGEVAASFPTYRSYLPEAGAEALRTALADAERRRPELAASLVGLGRRLADPADELAVRFQQTTGMVTAKGVEDTTFYRFNRFVALNEVGGDPDRFGVAPEEFHAAAAERQRRWPYAMTALSTHDTKRSEDVRARLAVISELPEEWAAAVRRWAAGCPAPDANLGYLFWQTLVGAWPLPADRAYAYLAKASREAKQHTSWTDPDADYDAAVARFVEQVYADVDLLGDVGAFADRLAPDGWSNSLGQKLIQLAMPGVPDLYQGSELWDLSLVDPDNRRPVDYALRRKLLGRIREGWRPPVDATGAAKLFATWHALQLRRELPEAFAGEHRPLAAAGPGAGHVVAFSRAGTVAAVATRLPVGLRRRGGWPGTTLQLPTGGWTDRLTGRTVAGGDLPLAELLADYPVALLVRDGASRRLGR